MRSALFIAVANRRRKTRNSIKLLQLYMQTLGRLMPERAARKAEAIWMQTRRFPIREAERRLLATATQTTCIINDETLAIYQWGNGPRILLMHGWNGRASQLMGFVEPLVTAGFSVIAFDAPGHGASTGSSCSVFEVANAAIALDRQFGPIHGAIAHSFGGVCLVTAIHQGLNCERAVSIAAPATVIGLLERFMDALSMPVKVRQILLERLKSRYGVDTIHEVAMVNRVKALSIPGLVIHDEDDPDVPCQQGKEIANAWSGAELLLTRTLGHHRVLRDPKVIETTVAFMVQTR